MAVHDAIVGDITKAIDPARVGLSKSTLTSGAICMRKSYYGEKIRDESGRRVGLTMTEPILFGKALDGMTLFVLAAKRKGAEYISADAVDFGIADASSSAPAGIDPETFRAELNLAALAFEPIADGFIRRAGSGGKVWLQGWDGESMRYADLIGTPDLMIESSNPEEMPTIIDVKATKRRKTEADLIGIEMGFYAHLYRKSRKHAGALRVAYLSWSRTKEPYWFYVEKEVTVEHEVIAMAQLSALRGALKQKTDKQVPFSTTYCGSCQYAKPQPSHNFGGCEVGRAVVAFAATEEE